MNQSTICRISIMLSLLFGLTSLCPVVANGQAASDAAGPSAAQSARSALPLDLAQAQRMALSGNTNLASVAERVQQAQQQARLALPDEGPVIEIPSAPKRSDPGLDSALPLEPTPVEPQDTLRASLGARWTFYRGLQQRFDNAALRFSERQSLAALAEAKRLLLAAVAESFFQAQLARERTLIAAADLAQWQRLASMARSANGPAKQLASLEAGVKTAQKELRMQRGAEVRSLRMLAILIGLPEERSLNGIEMVSIPEESPQELQAPDAEALALYAERNRPDVLQAEFALHRLDAAHRSAKAGLEPDLTLRGALESELNRKERLSPEEVDSSVGIFMEIPLSTQADRRARQKDTERRKSQAQQALNDARAAARAEVLEAVQRVSASQQRLLQERQQLLQAEQRGQAVSQEIAKGRASIESMIQSQQALSNARLNLATARINLREAWSLLDAGTGHILALFEAQAPLPPGQPTG